MLLLVTQGMPQMRQHAHHGLPWAAANDCFQGLDERRWRTMLESIKHASG
jgi:hypothetical protein